jgi:hypothetical protein
LLGTHRRHLLAGAVLKYYFGYWSPWIVAEVVRQRTEWIAERAVREGVSASELRRRLLVSRERVNTLLREASLGLRVVNHASAPSTGLAWLQDVDDWPIMQTALAARAHVLVTENTRDFPRGEARNGILLLGAQEFLQRLFSRYLVAQERIDEFLVADR